MELISVVIPFYKKKNFIKKAIESILNQTYSNIEIILIYDDKDKEDLIYLNDNFGSNQKIKILVNNKNLGAGLSRNRGIQISNGKYICFLDADDLWHKEKISKQIAFMKKFNYKISHTSYEIVDDYNNLKSLRRAKDFSSYKDILKSCDIGLSTVAIEKDIISDELKFVSLKTKEDFVLWLLILKSGIKIGGLDEILVSWRKTKNSLSSSVLQKLIDGYRVYRNYMKYNPIKSLYLLICLSINYLKK